MERWPSGLLCRRLAHQIAIAIYLFKANAYLRPIGLSEVTGESGRLLCGQRKAQKNGEVAEWSPLSKIGAPNRYRDLSF